MFDLLEARPIYDLKGHDKYLPTYNYESARIRKSEVRYRILLRQVGDVHVLQPRREAHRLGRRRQQRLRLADQHRRGGREDRRWAATLTRDASNRLTPCPFLAGVTRCDPDLLAEKIRRTKRDVGKADALTEKIHNKYQVLFLRIVIAPAI